MRPIFEHVAHAGKEMGWLISRGAQCFAALPDW